MAYLGAAGYRARLHSALLLEEVLVRHPTLRVYISHAGWPMLDDLLAVLWAHPQVYVDVAVINWALPTREFYRYLRRILEAGFGSRVMYGSEQLKLGNESKNSIQGADGSSVALARAVATELDAEKASAECKNGLLTVRIPKTPAAKPRKISVQSA